MDPVTLCTNPSQLLKVRKTLFQNSRRYTHFYRLSHSELVDIEKVALSSSLRSLKSKCTIESRAKKRSSINLIRTPNIRVNSFTMKMEILLEPTSNKLMVGRPPRIRRIFKMDFRYSDTTDNLFSKVRSVKVKEYQEMMQQDVLVDDAQDAQITMSNTSIKEQAQSKKINDQQQQSSQEKVKSTSQI
ncbi:hypothetical protein Tco_0004489 [Tanacetum coccineum]